MTGLFNMFGEAPEGMQEIYHKKCKFPPIHSSFNLISRTYIKYIYKDKVQWARLISNLTKIRHDTLNNDDVNETPKILPTYPSENKRWKMQDKWKQNSLQSRLSDIQQSHSNGFFQSVRNYIKSII